MGNPYRKLFNLFALSLLAFAVYINFFRSEHDLLPERNLPGNDASISAHNSRQPATDIAKVPLARVDKKN